MNLENIVLVKVASHKRPHKARFHLNAKLRMGEPRGGAARDYQGLGEEVNSSGYGCLWEQWECSGISDDAGQTP